MSQKTAALLLMGFLFSFPALSADQKKKKEEPTQTLEVLKEPPLIVKADTSRLVFQVSPLSDKGLLSPQIREALKSLFRQNANAAIVRLRAFVAGTGDTRRVQTIVSEMFTEKHAPLPVLTVVLAGALPLTGAQVVIESTAMAKKPVNPYGLAFISGQAASTPEPEAEVAPLFEKSVSSLARTVSSLGLGSEDVLRATCFLSSLDGLDALRQRLAAAFPQAAMNFVQIQRAPLHSVAECEAVARLTAPAGQPLRFAGGSAGSSGSSQAALVSASQVVLTGAQLGFHFKDEDARLVFKRLDKELGEAGASLHQAAMVSAYPLSNSIGGLVRKVRAEFYGSSNPPAGTMLPFEGLPALDASFAVDVIAVSSNPK